MDLSSVKTAVKAWEKGFRAREGRAPTKDDIKRDPSGIADQYALYRKLSKVSSSQPPSSTSTSHSISSVAGSSTTPRSIPNDEYPTTPTPPTRRSTIYLNGSAVSTSRTNGANGTNGEHDQTLKRKASTIISPTKTSSTPTTASRSFITPKKPRPSYSGPVIDPNPVNPFAITPPRPSPSISLTTAGLSTHTQTHTQQSPFLHASSPRKLKELLHNNSLRKVKERNGLSEITPRTKARRRLAGEIGDTPVKEKPRRRRGEARSESIGNDDIEAERRNAGRRAMVEEDMIDGVEEDEEDDDEFGPSPMKPLVSHTGTTRTFTELLSVEREEVTVRVVQRGSNGVKLKGASSRLPKGKEKEKRGRPSEMLGLFGRVKSTDKIAKGKSQESDFQLAGSRPETLEANGNAASSQIPERQQGSSSRSPEIKDTLSGVQDNEGWEDPEEQNMVDAKLDEAYSVATPSRAAPRQKVLSFSDDEEDEWDPEGGAVRRSVVITGTRRAAQRQDSDDLSEDIHAPTTDDEGGDQQPPEDEEEGEVGGEGDGDGDGNLPILGDGTTSTSPTHPPSTPGAGLNPSLLDLLSLKSPPQKPDPKLTDLRVKALFNPSDAIRLRAARKGQDIYVSGEGGDIEGEEEVLDQYGFGVTPSGEWAQDGGDGDGGEGDDDWEEEPEGWKRTQVGMDDEW